MRTKDQIKEELVGGKAPALLFQVLVAEAVLETREAQLTMNMDMLLDSPEGTRFLIASLVGGAKVLSETSAEILKAVVLLEEYRRDQWGKG